MADALIASPDALTMRAWTSKSESRPSSLLLMSSLNWVRAGSGIELTKRPTLQGLKALF